MPRGNYQQIISDLGFNFSADYWTEDSYYRFNDEEVNRIYAVTNTAYKLYCQVIQNVIDNDLFYRFGITDQGIIDHIIRSWNEDDLSLYGRFDLAFDNSGNIKLLEFNADTPTSLFEASVVQWQWKEEMYPFSDQMNSIHEALVKSWEDIHNVYQYDRYDFGCITDVDEENTTTSYILSTCQEAGLNTSLVDMREIVRDNESFYLPTGEVINCLFKLYPWEDLFNEEFGKYIPTTEMIWIEPSWKMLMSNKESLVLLYEMYGGDYDFILPTYDHPNYLSSYCKKPRYGREGQNTEIVIGSKCIERTDGSYGSDNFIYQDLVNIGRHDNKVPIIGSWVIGGEASGIGIRETDTLITDNMAKFVPHIIL